MTIGFQQVPGGIRAPFAYIEFDGSRAQQGPSIQPYTALLVGQLLHANAANALIPFPVTGEDQAVTYFGSGSVCHEMARAWFATNKFTPLTMIGLDDAAGATATQKTITVTGPATAAGTIALYIAGRRIQIGVANGASNTTVAGAINSAINADTTLMVTSGVASNVATLTCKCKGTVGNDIDLRHSFYFGEALPAGITLAFAQSVAGSGDPSLSTSNFWSFVGEVPYNIYGFQFNDSGNIATVTTELASRWSATRMIDGMAFMGLRSTLSTALTLGATLNSPYLCVLPVNSAPTWTPAIAASLSARVALSATIDPARQFRTLELDYCLPPIQSQRFILSERDQLLHNGMATYVGASDGSFLIDRLATTYQKNAGGALDTAYLDATTPLTLSYLRYDFRTTLETKYPRHKLADDGTRFGAGQPVMTPSLGKAESIACFERWEEKGLVEGFDQFKRDLIVERDTSDPNRMNFLLSPNLINNLMIAGGRIEFIL